MPRPHCARLEGHLQENGGLLLSGRQEKALFSIKTFLKDILE
jgi:hypothetical protein